MGSSPFRLFRYFHLFRTRSSPSSINQKKADRFKRRNLPNVDLSEIELQRELYHARVSGRSNRPEGRVADHAVGIRERRRVREVENFRAEFEVSDFAEIRPLDEGDIRCAIAGSTHRVAGSVPERELGRDVEG